MHCTGYVCQKAVCLLYVTIWSRTDSLRELMDLKVTNCRKACWEHVHPIVNQTAAISATLYALKA